MPGNYMDYSGSEDPLAEARQREVSELEAVRKLMTRLSAKNFDRLLSIPKIALVLRSDGIQGLPPQAIEYIQTLMTGEIEHLIVCARDGDTHGHLLHSDKMREDLAERERNEQHKGDGEPNAVPKPAGRLIRTPRDAELAAEEWMRFFGFGDAAVTRVGADEGIDVTATRAVAQVKAYMVPVGRPDVQNLAGVAAAEKKSGIFFALSGYTPQAIQWADKANIALFSFDLQGEPEPVNQVARELVP